MAGAQLTTERPLVQSRRPAQPPPKLAERVVIGPHDRALFVGRTGSGKTTLARAMLPAYPRFAVFDPKRTYTMPGVPTVERFDAKLDRQIVRLPFERHRRGEHARWGDELYKAWRAGNRILYIDEVAGLSKVYPPLPELAWAVKTGRERGVGVWAGSQRPKMIPSDLYTESEHFFIFDLQFASDRARVSSFTNPHVYKSIINLKDYAYVYYHVSTDSMRRFGALGGIKR